MKKLIPVFFLLAAVVLVGSWCGQKPAEEPTGESQETQGTEEENGGIFSSIRDAFDRSMSLRCEYVDEEGNASVNYIKNKMVRTEAVDAEQGLKIYGLFRDEKMYFWTEGSSEGMIFDLSGMGEEPGEMGGTEVRSVDDIITELEAKKDMCRTESVPDSYFELPAGVNFQSLNLNFGQ